jgi:acid phosphatase
LVVIVVLIQFLLIPRTFATVASTACTNGVPFLIHGDWGTPGENQTKIADQMNSWSLQNQAMFLVALGDNFYYDGVDNVTDPQWDTSYRSVYTQPGLQIPWYVILGNHDYHSNPAAQIDYFEKHLDDRWILPDYLYSRRYPLPVSIASTSSSLRTATNCGLSGNDACYLEIIFIDTPTLSPSETSQTRPSGKHAVTAEMLSSYLERLELQLQASEAAWLIVAGHYTIFSMADHGDNAELISRVVPLLQKYKVQLYLNGHDHVLQHMSWEGVEYVTSGHGTYTNHFPDAAFNFVRGSIAESGLRFASLRPGFSTACVTAKQGLTLHMVDVDGQDLYQFTLTNPRTAAILQEIHRSTTTDIEESTVTSIAELFALLAADNQVLVWYTILILLMGICFGLCCITSCLAIVARHGLPSSRASLLVEMEKSNRKRDKRRSVTQLMSKMLMSWRPISRRNSSGWDNGDSTHDELSVELSPHQKHHLLSQSMDSMDSDMDDQHNSDEYDKRPLSQSSTVEEDIDEFSSTAEFVRSLRANEKQVEKQKRSVPTHVQQRYQQLRKERKEKELQMRQQHHHGPSITTVHNPQHDGQDNV